MRTTIRIDDQLFFEVKKFAASSKKSLTAVVEDALRKLLSHRNQEGRAADLKLTTFRGKGLFPGVDLDDSASLLDTMEREK
jgi:Arc/MetJ family transcription regulator